MLKPQEKFIARPGSMCFMSGSIEMENVFIPENEVGVWQWFFGKAVTSVVFHNPGLSDGFVGIAAPSLARILPAAANLLVVKLLRSQMHSFVQSKVLEVGEVLAVDVSCIAALNTTVNVQIKYNGPVRRAVFGGDNLVTATLTGPGIVFIQSLPFRRFSQRIARAVTSPNMRDNPKFFVQIAIFFFLAYVVIVSSLILTDV
uniref:Uncharacterized protein n=1 Tax=Salix viminalis TaxID=40686 RepID=A0A6N2K547_SALVM